ncbi:hypothetical protein N9E31_03635 [Paracoccaceae bacterium]|nr:hypothetical protein [Paracoccaceae bacterium]
MMQKPKASRTGSCAEHRDQRLKQALKSNLAKRKAQAKAKAGKPVENAPQSAVSLSISALSTNRSLRIRAPSL